MINFTPDTLYTQSIPSNIIPVAAFREALKLPHLDPKVSRLLELFQEKSNAEWREWQREDKGSFTGTWTKRFRKLLSSNYDYKISDTQLSLIGETLKRYTKEGTYYFEITKFMDWKPGDFAERDNTSCWWNSYNNSRLGLKQDPRGHAVLFYESEHQWKAYSKKQGIGRCWLLEDTNYTALFNAYGVPLSEIATALAARFGVDAHKTELHSQNAYINAGNKNNDGGSGGQTGLGYVLTNEFSKLPVPVDMGDFQYKHPCRVCGRKVKTHDYVYRDHNNRQVSGKICDSCIQGVDRCGNCECSVPKDDLKLMFDGDRGTRRKLCGYCLSQKSISICEGHGEHIGRTYKIFHKSKHYCHTCYANGVIAKCYGCSHVVDEYKTLKIVGDTKLCKSCANKTIKELQND